MNYCKDNQNNVFAYSDIQTQKNGGWLAALPKWYVKFSAISNQKFPIC